MALAGRPSFPVSAALLPGLSIEHADDIVVVKLHAGDHLGPELNPLRISLQGWGHAPEPRRVIPAPGRDDLAVGAEGHGYDGARMGQEGSERGAVGDIPQPGGPGGADGQYGPAVGAEGDGL